MINVREIFGDIDIYLFDQILKGRFNIQTSIIDAGCSGGRNLIYSAIEQVRLLAYSLSPKLSKDNFQTAAIEKMPFQDAQFDAIISSAVLHFADNEQHFYRMLEEMWRVLKTGGLFFARLASTIGIENEIQLIEERRYLLPDGSERFLADEELLNEAAKRIGAIQIEPLKTTNVQNLRCMTTWVLLKN